MEKKKREILRFEAVGSPRDCDRRNEKRIDRALFSKGTTKGLSKSIAYTHTHIQIVEVTGAKNVALNKIVDRSK